MKERRGHIVTCSSVLGFLGMIGYAAYSPTKFAICGLTESLRSEMKPYNIRFSILYPARHRHARICKGKRDQARRSHDHLRGRGPHDAGAGREKAHAGSNRRTNFTSRSGQATAPLVDCPPLPEPCAPDNGWRVTKAKAIKKARKNDGDKKIPRRTAGDFVLSMIML